MSPAGFEHIIPASERPQTHILDGATTETGLMLKLYSIYLLCDTAGLLQVYPENILRTSFTSSSVHRPKLINARHITL
jgi:hypothetical protein